MPYFVKNELNTVPDSPVDADFNGTGIKCTVAIASNTCSSDNTLLRDKRV